MSAKHSRRSNVLEGGRRKVANGEGKGEKSILCIVRIREGRKRGARTRDVVFSEAKRLQTIGN